MSTKHGPKSGKGKKIQGKAAAKGKRVAKAAAATEPAPKRKRDMTIEDLQAEFRRVTGRDTQSRDRR
ncbi:MAG TPA: hypothetical protein PKG98_12760, partial [Myxococcota bacterium]|nr:hypothetical protein [Myxococcota bacterium]